MSRTVDIDYRSWWIYRPKDNTTTFVVKANSKELLRVFVAVNPDWKGHQPQADKYYISWSAKRPLLEEFLSLYMTRFVGFSYNEKKRFAIGAAVVLNSFGPAKAAKYGWGFTTRAGVLFDGVWKLTAGEVFALMLEAREMTHARLKDVEDMKADSFSQFVPPTPKLWAAVPL